MPTTAPTISIVIPAYNEESTIRACVLAAIRQTVPAAEIIVVDNCSTDGTRELLQSLLDSGEAGTFDSQSTLRVVLQTENNGKGSSVRRALELARGEYVIVQDADLEYDPQDFLRLLDKAESKGKKRGCDVVFGTRLSHKTSTRREQPRTSFYYGRVGLSVLLRILYAVPISDVATCYKLLRREVAQNLDLRSSGFDLDFEIGAKVAKLRKKRSIRFAEVPVSYSPRTELEGKKIRAIHDGSRAVWALLRYRFTN